MSDLKSSLKSRIEDAINITSRENESNTPDFILAEYLMKCLEAFESTSLRREEWFGKSLDIGFNSTLDSDSEVVKDSK